MMDPWRIDYAPQRQQQQKIHAVFHRYGLAVVKNLLPAEAIQDMVNELLMLMRSRLERLGHGVDDTLGLDATFEVLCGIDRKLGGEIYDVAPHLPSYHRLVTNKKIISMVKHLMGAELLQIPFDLSNLRIDQPGEVKFLFEWHQDYTYNLLSRNAITALIPLSDTTAEMGCLHVIPASHRDISDTIVRDSQFVAGQGGGGRILGVAGDSHELERQAVAVPIRRDETLLVHALLLHRSGRNASSQTRWSVNPRYGDFLEQDLVQRGWVKGIKPGHITFPSVHPDKVVA